MDVFDIKEASEEALNLLARFGETEDEFEKSLVEKEAYNLLNEGLFKSLNEARWDRSIASFPVADWGDDEASDFAYQLREAIKPFPQLVGRSLGTYAQGLILGFVLYEAILFHREFQVLGIRLGEMFEDWALWVDAHREELPYHYAYMRHRLDNVRNEAHVRIETPSEREEFDRWYERLEAELGLK